MKKVKESIIFENDEDFIENCVCKDLNICRMPNSGVLYSDWNFTNFYNDAVNKGYNLIIDDENSLIKKRQAVSYKTNTKEVKVS